MSEAESTSPFARLYNGPEPRLAARCNPFEMASILSRWDAVYDEKHYQQRIADAMSDDFDVHHEVHGKHHTGKRVRCDIALITRRDMGHTPAQSLFVVEVKKSDSNHRYFPHDGIKQVADYVASTFVIGDNILTPRFGFVFNPFLATAEFHKCWAGVTGYGDKPKETPLRQFSDNYVAGALRTASKFGVGHIEFDGDHYKLMVNHNHYICGRGANGFVWTRANPMPKSRLGAR